MYKYKANFNKSVHLFDVIKNSGTVAALRNSSRPPRATGGQLFRLPAYLRKWVMNWDRR